MYVTEIDSFVKKFHQLWKAGVTVHLDLDAHAGKAWVGIRAQVGDAPGPVPQQVHPRRSPSYLRRQERRREAAQAAQAAQAAEVDSSSPASKVSGEKPGDDKTAAEAETVEKVTVEDTCNTATNRLVMELDKKETRPVETGLPSPMIQLDGDAEEDIARFAFESTYHEDDVNELLSEIFPESDVKLSLESRVKVAPLSNREIFVIRLEPTATTKKFLSWPKMENDQADVFENVKRLK